MPTNRNKRTRARRRAPGLPGSVRYYLLCGHYHSLKAVSEDEFRQYWEWHRDELIAYAIQDPDAFVRGELSNWDYPDPVGPGFRPHAWWKYDAPEERRILDWGAITGLEKRLLGKVRHPDLHFEDERLETSFEYLYRLNLLTKAEHRWFDRYPQITFDDWCLLFRKRWQCMRERTDHIRLWHGHLTEKGKASERLVLAYWDRLDLAWSLPANRDPKLLDIGYKLLAQNEEQHG